MAAVESRMNFKEGSFTATFSGISGFPVAIGEFVSSPLVKVGGHTWCVKLYPGGKLKNRSNFSCYVALESKGEVRAKCKISFVNQNKGIAVGLTDTGDNVVSFSTTERYGGEYGKYYCRDNGYLANDQLIVKVELSVCCEVELINCNNADDTTLSSNLTSILFDGTTSDITMRVGEERLPVHKTILCMRSAVFKAMLNSPMQESELNTIEVSDFEPAVVKEFLHFVYTDSCSPKIMETHAEQLLAIACKYQVKGLETLCENHLCSTLTVDNIVSVLLLAEMYSARHLKNRALRFIARNSRLLVQNERFFDGANSTLCQEVMRAVVTQGDNHTRKPALPTNKEVTQVVMVVILICSSLLLLVLKSLSHQPL